MAVQTWEEVIRRGSQRAIATGRQGAQGTGYTAEELGALREAELAVGARSALDNRRQEESERNAAFNRDLAERQISGQEKSQMAGLATQGIVTALGTYDKWGSILKGATTPAVTNASPAVSTPAITGVSEGIGLTSSGAAVNTGVITDAAAVTAAETGAVGAPVGMSAAELGVSTVGSGATLTGAASAAAAAAPYAAAGYVAGKTGGKFLEKQWGEGSSNVMSQMGRTIQDILGGIGKPWMKEIVKDPKTQREVKTVMDVLNPIGYILSDIFGL